MESVTEHLELHGIRDPDVLRVMDEVPRRLFVPEHLRLQSSGDYPLPIGYGATISQPYIVGRMTELLQLECKHRVLEIGTGSGYQAAILSRLAGHVYTIEIVPELAQTADARLQELGYHNITVKEGDGYMGWPEFAPFERIILTAAPREIPATLLDQLASGGRLVAPVGKLQHQELILVEKGTDGRIQRRTVTSVTFVPMKRTAHEL